LLLQVWPAYFDLAPGQQAGMSVQFSPPCPGRHTAGFVLVCDNCQVSHFAVSGTGCCVDVAVTHLDGRALFPGKLRLPLWLGQLPPGAAASRMVTLRNSTSMPFPFCWREVAEGGGGEGGGAGGHQLLPAPVEAAPLWQLGSMDAVDAEQLLLLLPSGSPDGGGISRGSVAAVEAADEFGAEPASGVLQPGEELEVALTYRPRRVGRWAPAAQSAQLGCFAPQA
jgi:hypothetical protein